MPKDRVVEMRRVTGAELRANPLNFRSHPTEQRETLRGIVDQIGIAGALIAYEHPEHGLTLIDGHLRAEDYGDTEWPVIVLDVTEDEAALLLATHDPIAAMADTEPVKLRELLSVVDAESRAVNDLLASLNAQLPISFEDMADAPTQDKISEQEDRKAERYAGDADKGVQQVTCPECYAEFSYRPGAAD